MFISASIDAGDALLQQHDAKGKQTTRVETALRTSQSEIGLFHNKAAFTPKATERSGAPPYKVNV